MVEVTPAQTDSSDTTLSDVMFHDVHAVSLCRDSGYRYSRVLIHGRRFCLCVQCVIAAAHAQRLRSADARGIPGIGSSSQGRGEVHRVPQTAPLTGGSGRTGCVRRQVATVRAPRLKLATRLHVKQQKHKC